MRYVTGEVLRAEAPKLLEYRFGMGDGAVMSRVEVELTPETEAVKVVVTNDGFQDDDLTHMQNADGWPRILRQILLASCSCKSLMQHGESTLAQQSRSCKTGNHV